MTVQNMSKRRASPSFEDGRSTRHKRSSEMTEALFKQTYDAELGPRALERLRPHCPFPNDLWLQRPDSLLIPILMDHFVAKSYVLQPLHVEAPRHLQVERAGVRMALHASASLTRPYLIPYPRQFWEILKNLLALQVGDGVKRRVCVLSGAPEGELEGDEEEGEEEGEQEGEPDTAEDTPAAAASHTIQGYEAALTGGAVGGEWQGLGKQIGKSPRSRACANRFVYFVRRVVGTL